MRYNRRRINESRTRHGRSSLTESQAIRKIARIIAEAEDSKGKKTLQDYKAIALKASKNWNILKKEINRVFNEHSYVTLSKISRAGSFGIKDARSYIDHLIRSVFTEESGISEMDYNKYYDWLCNNAFTETVYKNIVNTLDNHLSDFEDVCDEYRQYKDDQRRTARWRKQQEREANRRAGIRRW